MSTLFLHIDPSATEPIYRQIMGQILRLIAAGHLRAGTQLPSVREVAATYAVNPMTVSKAYSLLETQGFLVRQRGKGMRVATYPHSQQPLDERLKTLEPLLTELGRQAQQLDIPAQQIAERLMRIMEDLQ